MQILFSDNETVDLLLDSIPLTSVYQKIYKHLCHVPIPFREWDNPYYVANMTYDQLVEKLVFYGSKVSLSIDSISCLARDQNYFNDIHKIYEKNYNGDPTWLDFHEHIHLCDVHLCEKDKITDCLKFLQIDHREKSGLLEQKFDFNWLETATTKIKAGDIFVQWAELGKTPYIYWKNGEPNNLSRMCELIKPWLILRPKLCIALEDIDMLGNIECDEFESWWKQYSEHWCKHWKIPSWNLNDIFSVVVFGRVPNFETIIEKLKKTVNPTKILF